MSEYMFLNLKITFKLIHKKDAKLVSKRTQEKGRKFIDFSTAISRSLQGFIQGVLPRLISM